MKAFALLALFAPALLAAQDLPEEPLWAFPNVEVVFMGRAKSRIDSVTKWVGDNSTEAAVCITRWEPQWRGDTLVALVVHAVVATPRYYADAYNFRYKDEAGLCWWAFPSVHWHIADAMTEPSPLDYESTRDSAAPFHVMYHATNGPLAYAVRLHEIRRMR